MSLNPIDGVSESHCTRSQILAWPVLEGIDQYSAWYYHICTTRCRKWYRTEILNLISILIFNLYFGVCSIDAVSDWVCYAAQGSSSWKIKHIIQYGFMYKWKGAALSFELHWMETSFTNISYKICILEKPGNLQLGGLGKPSYSLSLSAVLLSKEALWNIFSLHMFKVFRISWNLNHINFIGTKWHFQLHRNMNTELLVVGIPWIWVFKYEQWVVSLLLGVVFVFLFMFAQTTLNL